MKDWKRSEQMKRRKTTQDLLREIDDRIEGIRLQCEHIDIARKILLGRCIRERLIKGPASKKKFKAATGKDLARMGRIQ